MNPNPQYMLSLPPIHLSFLIFSTVANLLFIKYINYLIYLLFSLAYYTLWTKTNKQTIRKKLSFCDQLGHHLTILDCRYKWILGCCELEPFLTENFSPFSKSSCVTAPTLELTEKHCSGISDCLYNFLHDFG